jgi:hypothetical protein
MSWFTISSMNELELEKCPICWRGFSSDQVIPICLPCGHSFCRDCSMSIRSCSLCRQRFSSTIQRKTNYSLLSLLDKVNKPDIETKDQQIQTDTIDLPMNITTTNMRAPRQNRSSQNIQKQSITFQIKKTADGTISGIQLAFK